MVPGAALRFTRLGAQGFWFDEGNTALLVHMSPGRMLGLIPQSEPAHFRERLRRRRCSATAPWSSAGGLQAGHLGVAQPTVLAQAQVAQLERANRDPGE